MENNSLKAWRGIAWCSFLTDKTEQSMKYYQKIIDQKPQGIDYLNAGHVAWCGGQTKEAVTLYEKAAALFESKDHFISTFYKDKDFLLHKGIDEDDISLMIDLL